jgi:branched-subunit amino acid transport protein
VSAAWITVIALAVTSAMTRASGPVLMGGRDLPPRLAGVVDLLAPALLTALIVTGTLGGERKLEVNAGLLGVAAAGVVLLRRRGAILLAIVIAAAVTALLRALL